MVRLGLKPLSIAEVEAVARGGATVRLSPEALSSVERGREALAGVLSGREAHYGINTGFGSFSRQRIPAEGLRELQRNLIRSHAAGVGEALPREIVRGMMLLLAGSLTRGLSGVRREVVELIVGCLNAGITPVVPSIGSVGASGDLAPLAHVALALIGEGEVEAIDAAAGGRASGAALARAGLRALVLEAKEGLALINGTHLMGASAALAMSDTERLMGAALLAGAMSIDACRATDAFLDERVHAARGQRGQVEVARRLRGLIAGSGIVPSHMLNDPRVQDPYSLRCVPQVLGAVWDQIGHAREIVERELGAVTDNPLIFRRGASGRGGVEVISAGNFHGMPLAMAMDVLAIALCHIAGIAERRVYHMLSGFDPEAGLPPYLSPKPGLHSGLMIAQYTAAACCNELVGLATPASVANLSTSAGMEDYNSFGPRSAAKARRALELTRSVVAIELLCASEAVEHHRPLRSSASVERAIAIIREGVEGQGVARLTADRPPAPDIRIIERLIAAGAFGE